MSLRIMGLFIKQPTALDPVCGMNVEVKKAPGGTHMFAGTIYYFCGPGCRVAFSKSCVNIRGSFFSIKNSSVDFDLAPVNPRFTESNVSAHEITKKPMDIINNIFLTIFRSFFFF